MTESSHTPPRFFSDLHGWYSMTLLGLGSRVGLLDALAEGPGTAHEISARAHVDPRNCLEWLRAMTVAGHVTATKDSFALSEETAMVLGPDFPFGGLAIIDFAASTPAVLDDVLAAMRTGRGVASGAYQRAYGRRISEINAPTYAQALVEEWIGGVPGLTETLAAGGRVADLGCGNGAAAALIATAFPRTQVIGYDNDPATLVDSERLPDNVELREASASALPDHGRFDLIICLDSLHHFGNPAVVMDHVHQLLKPGGVFLIAEASLTGDLEVDSADSFALIIYSSSLLYCLQENLAAGGSGLTGADGPDWVTDALTTAGFHTVNSTMSESGFSIITGVA